MTSVFHDHGYKTTAMWGYCALTPGTIPGGYPEYPDQPRGGFYCKYSQEQFGQKTLVMQVFSRKIVTAVAAREHPNGWHSGTPGIGPVDR